MSTTLDHVKDVLGHTLGIPERVAAMGADAPLMDAIPELDSMAVVELLVALEERFGIHIDDADVTGEVFETLGSLAALVDEHRGVSPG